MKRKAKNYRVPLNQSIDDVWDILTGKIDGKLNNQQVLGVFQFPDGHREEVVDHNRFNMLTKVPDVKQVK